MFRPERGMLGIHYNFCLGESTNERVSMGPGTSRMGRGEGGGGGGEGTGGGERGSKRGRRGREQVAVLTCSFLDWRDEPNLAKY